MDAVAQTHAFVRAAKEAGMTEDEIDNLVDVLAESPTTGVDIPGSGGCRKLRFGGRGRGKSGGYRIVTFFTGDRFPVFLITVFAKGEKSDLSQAERNGLRALTKSIVHAYSTSLFPAPKRMN